MQQTVSQFEQVAQMLRDLPLEDYDRLRELINQEEQKKRENKDKERKLEEQLEKYRKAKNWLFENQQNYMNQWVCLEGDELIAHGTDALEVHNKAKALGIKAPFLHHIVEEEKNFWAGWL